MYKLVKIIKIMYNNETSNLSIGVISNLAIHLLLGDVKQQMENIINNVNNDNTKDRVTSIYHPTMWDVKNVNNEKKFENRY